MAKQQNKIGSRVKIFKRNERGERTEECIIEGIFQGHVEELVQFQTPFKPGLFKKPIAVTKFTHHTVALLEYEQDGIKKFGKVQLELVEFV